ncbi:hypothetical protein [Streptomyces sp. 891-h]|uniref:hypothetical protein n=1 Tax=Streptomyces sp. 891-h TaxID=2720714 RepID=UPI001FAACC1F|nr:hypothetical protein [Streptomyces sp. 891-h]UNZ16282.1 hypothetical protein HC362_03490 [Streptomyces sp. 891-h]
MAESDNRTGTGEPRSPWLRTGFVFAMAFVGFVAVIGVAVLVSSGSADSSDRGGGPGSASEPARSEKARARTGDGETDSDTSSGGGKSSHGGSSCPELDERQDDVLTAAPEGVAWKLFHAVALPASKAAGPAVVDGEVARCYAHTPLGALLATSQISVRYLAADDWRRVTRAQTVGAGRQSYIEARTESEKTADPQADEAQDRAAQGQIAGFKFVTYTSGAAVIQTVWRFPDGKMQAATTTALWRDGDWRLEYPADPAAPTPVDSLAGFVKWGGV